MTVIRQEEDVECISTFFLFVVKLLAKRFTVLNEILSLTISQLILCVQEPGLCEDLQAEGSHLVS